MGMVYCLMAWRHDLVRNYGLPDQTSYQEYGIDFCKNSIMATWLLEA